MAADAPPQPVVPRERPSLTDDEWKTVNGAERNLKYAMTWTFTKYPANDYRAVNEERFKPEFAMATDAVLYIPMLVQLIRKLTGNVDIQSKISTGDKVKAMQLIRDKREETYGS